MFCCLRFETFQTDVETSSGCARKRKKTKKEDDDHDGSKGKNEACVGEVPHESSMLCKALKSASETMFYAPMVRML